MNFRSSVAVVAATLLATACASGGGSTSSGEEGNRPRDTSFTQTAQLFLVQAQGTETPDPARYQQVLDAANQAIEEDSLNPLGYRLAGEAYVGLGDYEQADAMLDMAEELHPPYGEELNIVRENSWVVAYNEAIPALQSEDTDAAIGHFENANAIFGGRPEALLQLGSLYERSGQTDKALEAYQSVVDLTGGPRLAQQDSATQADWQEQEEIAAFNLAQGYARAERYPEALTAYESYLGRNPDNIAVTSNMASTLALMGMADSANAVYEGLMSRPGMGSRDLFVVGIGLYNAENYSQAAEAFKRSLAINNMSRDAAFNYAQSLFLAEQFENLDTAARHLMELDPNNPSAYLLAGQGLLNMEQTEEAIEISNISETLPFEVVRPALQPVQGGGANLSGAIRNKSLDEGSVVTLRFHFTTDAGIDAGTREVTVQTATPMSESDDVTETQAEVTFDTEFPSSEPIVGFWYEVVRP